MLARILVMRFSALGDVAMAVPVLRCALQQHPGLELVVVSRAAFQPLFEGMERVTFVAADLKGKHKGLPGLFRLFRELRAMRITAVADFHHVLRSRMVAAFFRFTGKRTASIDKGRTEKKAMTRKENKQLVPLPSSHERYAQVLQQLGFPVNLLIPASEPRFTASPLLPEQGYTNIGIAPFAQHEGKRYPLPLMEKVFAGLLENNRNRIYVFGGGKTELEQISEWEKRFPALISAAGKYTLAEELALMRQLHVMVSMDSANMHLASLVGTPVVSVWGATHPFAGFYGWKQHPANAVQTALYCRPCSVFGNKPCYRGDYACMNGIAPELVVEQVLHFKS